MCLQFVDALADFRKFLRSKVDEDIAVKWRPGFSAVARAKRACCGNPNDEASLAEALNRMHHHASGSRVPLLARRMIAQASDHLPIHAIVAAAEKHTRIGAEINGAGLVFRAGCDMPDAFQRGLR